jgi:hypothetical protein
LLRARLAAFEALSPASAYLNNPFGTIASYAVALRAGLRSGRGDEEYLLRLVIQMVDDFRHLEDDADRRFFLQEPSTTGEPRYDALLAGLAVFLCREARMRSCPSWVFAPSRYLRDFWWYGMAGDVPELRAHAFQNAPSCLKSRGVIFSERNLESV